MSSEKSSFLLWLLTGDPHRWTRGIGHSSGDCRKTKICMLVYQPIKILCTFVQIPNQYNISTYYMWVSNGGSWCLTSSNPDWVLFKHHLLTIKLHKKYICQCQQIYMYIGGKEVGHRFGSLQAPNQRKRYTNLQRKWYINVPAGSSEVGHRFGALQAPVPH